MAIEQVLKASHLKEVHEALARHGTEAALIAGGTDLCVKLREGHVRAKLLIDISDLSELREIGPRAEGFWIGAGLSFSEVLEHPQIKSAYPGLWQACKSVGAPQIRNRGTLGGNLANGSPAADSAPPLLALDARLKLSSQAESRWVALSDFYLDKGRTVLRADEVLEGILIPEDDSSFFLGFEKLGLRNALAISRLGISIYYVADELQVIRKVRVASGSIGLSPMREPLMEAFLIDKPLNEPTLSLAADYFGNIVEERLKGRSTCPFKREAVKGIFKAAVMGGTQNVKCEG